MSTAGYSVIPESSSSNHKNIYIKYPQQGYDMRYLNCLSYCPTAILESNPAMDSLDVDTRRDPSRYTHCDNHDDGYRVGPGGMAPKGGAYWSPPNSPKTAEVQQLRQQQHKSWKMERSSSNNTSSSEGTSSPHTNAGNGKSRRRGLRKLLRKLSSSGSSGEE